jgi:hypothetical protein
MHKAWSGVCGPDGWILKIGRRLSTGDASRKCAEIQNEGRLESTGILLQFFPCPTEPGRRFFLIKDLPFVEDILYIGYFLIVSSR